jgi:glycosyltransferase involved in cell wall biosynthesis
LGWPRETCVVAAFGQVSYGKRAEVVLEAFARFAAIEPHARFMWVGERSREYDLQVQVRRLGLVRKVVFTGRVAADALPDYLALADMAINLRFPTTGEASGAVMRLVSCGKPTLVSNIGWFAELPSEVVTKIDVGHSEVESIATHLARLATDRARYARMSAAAREYANARPPTRTARQYVEFVEAILKEDHARAA